MARFALLFLVACSKEPKPNVEASKPPSDAMLAIVADAMVIERAAVAPVSPHSAAMAMQAKCPVGDMTSVAVYGFLEREIDEANKLDGGKRATKDLIDLQASLEKQPDMKPPRAGIFETEISHALGVLCAGTDGCKAIGLYNKSGRAIALASRGSSYTPVGFLDPELKKLLDLPEGATIVRDGETYVINSIKRGLALCIVD